MKTVGKLILVVTLMLGAPAKGEWRTAAEDEGRQRLHESFKYDGSGKIKVAFFDADSTLRVAPSGNVSANGPRDAWLLPEVTAEIERLASEGYLIAIVSNQAGVPKMVPRLHADGALDHVRNVAKWLNPKAIIHYYDFAENKDHNRKPNTGMLERVEAMIKEKFNATIDKENSFMCGDAAYSKEETRPDGRKGFDISNSDRKVAENFGIRFTDPADQFGWRKYGFERFRFKTEVDEFYEKNPQLKKTGFGKCPIPSYAKLKDA
jgi:DNA 3'-phosphatase